MARVHKKRQRAVEADQPDLTPMIDITFQLVVFFLVANDLSRKEIEEVKLPQALAGVEDMGKEDQRIIINITPPPDPDNPPKYPDVKVKGKPYDLQKLGRFMKIQADRKREPPGGPNAPSEIFVLVRADRSAPWSHVQYVMQECAGPGVGIYKMQFATTKRDDGKASSAAESTK
jgi:biopolymer transport protein ExbD